MGTCRHYRKAQGALVVYDITKEPTFKSVKKWIEGIREHAAENVVIVIVGNKSDLKSEQVVTTAEGKRLAKELGCFFEETSAITGDNIESAFRNMLEGTRWLFRDTETKEAGVGAQERGQGLPAQDRTH